MPSKICVVYILLSKKFNFDKVAFHHHIFQLITTELFCVKLPNENIITLKVTISIPRQYNFLQSTILFLL